MGFFFTRLIYLYVILFHTLFICTSDSFHMIYLFLHVILSTRFISYCTWFFLHVILFQRDSIYFHVILSTSHLFWHVIPSTRVIYLFMWFILHVILFHMIQFCAQVIFFCPTRLISFHMWIFFYLIPFFPRDSFPFMWLIYFCMWFFSHDSFNSLCDSFHLIRSFPHMILFMWFISFPLVYFSTWLLLLLLFFFTSHSFTRLIYFSFYISILFTQMILSHGSFLLTFNHILLTKVKWVWFYFIEAGLSIILLIHGASCVRNSVSLRQELNS